MNRQLAKQYFERAEALLDAGKPGEALPLLDQLNDAFPNTKNILYARAKTYAALGRTNDALHACDALMEHHQSQRAAALKQQLVAPAQNASSHSEKGTKSAFSKPRLATIVVAGAAVIAAVGAAIWFQNLQTNEEQTAPAPQAVRIEQPAAPPQPAAPVPGRVHFPMAWERDDRGVPDWKAGIFRNVPCVNAPERTIDVYIPLAYDAKPDAQFPGVLISMAGGNPGFIGLEDWAERQEVVLVGLNSSRNGPAANNIEAQEAAFATIAPTMRVDQRLGFAIGMSGGAMASWLAVYRNADTFRGLVMMGQCGYFEYPLAPHVRVAYIRGRNEPSNWCIERMMGNLRANGNLVRDEMVEGAHVMGPVDRRVAMLNWMVHAARNDFGLPQPGE